MRNKNIEVYHFLEQIDHPFRNLIEHVRNVVLNASPLLNEKITGRKLVFYYHGNINICSIDLKPARTVSLVIAGCTPDQKPVTFDFKKSKELKEDKHCIVLLVKDCLNQITRNPG